MSRLKELATTVRSKNAGVDLITFDIIFKDREAYERVRRSGVLTREKVAALFHLSPEQITHFVEFDAAQAIKVTVRREKPSGSPGEVDVFGAQQYPPLLELEIPEK